MTQDLFNLGLARRDPAEEARFISLQRVRGYWEGLIGPGGALPGPAALDPRGLLPALEDVFLAERIGEGLLRLRIAGRRVSAPAGVDMQGLPLSAMFLAEARPALAHTVERVCNHNSLVTMELQAEGGFGRPALTARLLLLPLAAPLRGQPTVLGCLSTLGETGRAPRRFMVTAVVEERLGQRIRSASAAPTHSVTLPDFGQSALAQARNNQTEERVPDYIFAEKPADFTAAPLGEGAGGEAQATEPSARPKLRLVHSSD
ncbi:PAS domain-containing protein [Paracoccus sp. IB05]|uniref:PAS domain-containing protein n=1 Tax=Paracoccus sp. IB05 TaxID=2779367 RepID=UPI0018E7C813|nr:PAS domain-containing protein [Paracoccus sp. IB05]MBJ2152625.1 PAS domain-containing protein [Paracoccus sp. IB05]